MLNPEIPNAYNNIADSKPAKSPQTAPQELQGGVRVCPVIPTGAMLVGVLKTLENQLQTRLMLRPATQNSFNPLWFLAETERNVFLWRRGCSLVQQDQFEFWINVRGLISKRLTQLEGCDYSNPFTNPFWGGTLPDRNVMGAERDYLFSFIEILGEIEGHAHALSKLGSILEAEVALLPQKSSREIVVLPSGHAA